MEAVARTVDGSGHMVNEAAGLKEEEDLDRKWLDSINKKLVAEPGKIKVSSTRSSCSIHRVPQCFFQHDKKAYVPQIISIGPFHYDKRENTLQAMEEHKWRYLRAVVTRRKNSLQQYLKAVKLLEEEARECYSEEISLNSNHFVEMMVLDGCFIIELLCRSAHEWEDEVEDDPLLSLSWLKQTLMCDLLKLENQIPFFILQYLFQLMKIPGDSLLKRALAFFKTVLPKNKQFNLHYSPQTQHLLHLLHSTRIPTIKDDSALVKGEKKNTTTIHCASELQRAGIEFKKRKTKESFMDITFKKKRFLKKIFLETGVIEIPHFKVEDSTNPILLNLVAFEQCYSACGPYFTAYTNFIDCLIDSNVDVGILCRREIIENKLGSDKDVAAMFNKIGREVIIDPDNFYLLGVVCEVNDYYGAKWNKWRASLMRNYFNSPWAIISVSAAILLLILTFVQALFTAFPSFAAGKGR